MFLALQIMLMLLFPAFSLWYQQRSKLSDWLSAIVLCYLVGILLRNFTSFPVDDAIAKQFTEISILIAIPLLLFSTKIKEAFISGKSALYSFIACVLAGLLSCVLAFWIFDSKVEDAWKIAGMLVGVYTGGTPNMQAIGLALDAKQSSIILLNAADILTGGLYLIVLTSFLPGLLARFLPPYSSADLSETNNLSLNMESETIDQEQKWKEWALAIGLSIFVLTLSIGLCYLLFAAIDQVAFIMLSLTTLSLVASNLPFVKKWEYTYDVGEYFLLIFCVALGLQANLQEIISEGGTILVFTAVAMYTTILIHLLFAKLLKVDRDTFLISSTAALYGPAFIGQIASVLKNRSLIFPGIALGLIGYAVGNYLGIALATLLKLL